MGEPHVAEGTLEAYLLGALDAVELARVEAHVTSCAACEARLQREAALEIAFAHVADRAAVAERPRRATRFAARLAAVGGGVLAVAAATSLWLAPRADDGARAAAPPPETIGAPVGDASTATARLDLPGDGDVRGAVRD